MRWRICFLLVFFLLLSARAEARPHSAENLGRNSQREGTLSAETLEAWYALRLDTKGQVEIEVTASPSLSITAFLIDVNGTTRLQSNTTGTTSARTLGHTHLHPGTYYVLVQRTSGSGTFVIQNRFLESERPGDILPSSTPKEAYALDLQRQATGLLGFVREGNPDLGAWVTITTDTPGALALRVVGDESLKLHVQLFDTNGTTSLENNTAGTSSVREVGHTHLNPGTYYVHIRRHTGYGRYNVSASLHPLDTSRDRKPDNTRETAYPLMLLEEQTGLLGFYAGGRTDSSAWYTITTKEPGILDITVSGEDSLKLHAQLFDTNGTTSLENNTAGTTSLREVGHTYLNPGTYYVHIRRHTGYGRYVVSAALHPLNTSRDKKPDNTRETAYPLMLLEEQTGLLGFYAGGRIDASAWYAITTKEPGILNIAVSGEDTLKLHAQLFDTNGTTSLENNTAGTTSLREVGHTHLNPGTYYLHIRRHTGHGRYLVSAALHPLNTSRDRKPDNTRETAYPLMLSEEQTGLLGFYAGGRTDASAWYTITTKEPGILNIAVSGEESLKLHAQLFDTNGTTSLQNNTAGTTSLREVGHTHLNPGTYYLHIRRHTGHGRYLVSAALHPLSTAQDKKPDNAREAAYPLLLFEEQTGLLGFYAGGRTDSSAWYAVTTKEPGTLRVVIEGEESLALHAQLFDTNGRTSLENNTAGTASLRKLGHTHVNPGTYYLHVRRHTGHGRYTIHAYTLSHPYSAPLPKGEEQTIRLSIGHTKGLLGFYEGGVTDGVTRYSFSLPNPSPLLIQVVAEESLKVTLNLHQETARRGSDTTGSLSSRLLQSNLEQGEYVLSVQRASGYGGMSILVTDKEDRFFVNPKEHDFGWVAHGEKSKVMNFCLVHTFSTPQSATSVRLVGEGFSFVLDEVSGKVLPPTSQGRVQVVFEPKRPGLHEGALEFGTPHGVITIPLKSHGYKEYEEVKKEGRTEHLDPSSEEEALWQWAKFAVASSEYTAGSWSAMQATGPPAVYPAYGDSAYAFATKHANDNLQWLELHYETPVYPKEVHVYETYYPGSIVKVEGRLGDGLWDVLWQGDAVIAPLTARIFVVEVQGEALVDTLRLVLDTGKVPGWNEIDAVRLKGVKAEDKGASLKDPALFGVMEVRDKIAYLWRLGAIEESLAFVSEHVRSHYAQVLREIWERSPETLALMADDLEKAEVTFLSESVSLDFRSHRTAELTLEKEGVSYRIVFVEYGQWFLATF